MAIININSYLILLGYSLHHHGPMLTEVFVTYQYVPPLLYHWVYMFRGNTFLNENISNPAIYILLTIISEQKCE